MPTALLRYLKRYVTHFDDSNSHLGVSKDFQERQSQKLLEQFL